MTHARRVASLALLMTAVPATGLAADVFVLGELPVIHTPMSRYYDSNSKRNIALPLTGGVRVSCSFDTGVKRKVFTGLTARGGVTGTASRLIQIRYDSGYRRLLRERERSQPFLELGWGFEAVQVRYWTDGLFDIGTGPTLGFGWLLGEQHGTVIGTRVTSNLAPGNYSMSSDDFENDTWYSVLYSPSNVSLALVVGKVI